eukprot:scaffold48686_cov60-Cyclotella_meneghiniana.AAC.5
MYNSPRTDGNILPDNGWEITGDFSYVNHCSVSHHAILPDGNFVHITPYGGAIPYRSTGPDGDITYNASGRCHEGGTWRDGGHDTVHGHESRGGDEFFGVTAYF